MGFSPRLRKVAQLAFLCFGVFMVYLDATIVNVALPEIQEALSADISQLQWVIDTYTLVFACLLLTAGTVGDIHGRKRLFLVGLAGFTVTSALCAVADSVDLLLAARALQGAFGAVMIPTSLSLVSTVYDDAASRARHRRVVGSGRAGALRRTRPRRRPRRELRLGEHLLGERADRPVRGGRTAPTARRVPLRRGPPCRPGRPGAVRARRRGARVRPDRGRTAGLGLRRDRGVLPGERRRAAGVRALGTARSAPGCASSR